MRQLIKIISATVILATLFSLCSCGHIWRGGSINYPEGYTGGLGITYGSGVEYYWVETYDEVLEAIDELESYGSTFTESAFFNYEGELFDTKYCFIFGGKKHSVKKGKKLTERWAENVEIRSYGFFEDVSIPELEYSLITEYDVVELKPTRSFYEFHNEGEILDINSLTYYISDENGSFCIDIEQGDVWLFSVRREKKHIDKKISEESFNAIFNSMVFIGKDDPYYNKDK